MRQVILLCSHPDVRHHQAYSTSTCHFSHNIIIIFFVCVFVRVQELVGIWQLSDIFIKMQVGKGLCVSFPLQCTKFVKLKSVKTLGRVFVYGNFECKWLLLSSESHARDRVCFKFLATIIIILIASAAPPTIIDLVVPSIKCSKCSNKMSMHLLAPLRKIRRKCLISPAQFFIFAAVLFIGSFQRTQHMLPY